eukprot:TRINITY_DN3934_c0_g1_i1.p1 TRINITY_DN3934_c0_g1~~TRINITY_DN3934_c0_g1_i1.p1  ORF type:complete len:445 (-),score=59.50 TRINITY_DN3934_c0_g1_i1:145-1479(-)
MSIKYDAKSFKLHYKINASNNISNIRYQNNKQILLFMEPAQPKKYFVSSYKELREHLKKGEKLIVYEDVVLSLDSFFLHYPDSKSVIEKYLGMEVSRFIYGGFQMLNSLAQDQLQSFIKNAENMTVGRIKDPLPELVFRPINPSLGLIPKNETWKLVDKEMITPVHGEFKLRSENFKVSGMLPYFDHCGKYFTVYSKYLKMGRNLACVFTPSETILPHYLKLLEAFNKGEDFAPVYPDITNITKPYLELYIKKTGVFSSYVHGLPTIGQEGTKNEFQVLGPFGPGLSLEPDQKGTIVGIICGTGVVMFLDLAMYMLRASIYKIGQQKLGKTYKVFGNEIFDRLTDPSFKLVIFSSFKKKDHVLGEPLFQALHDISAKYNLGNFEYHLRISERPEDPKWDEEFFKKTLDKQARKIIVYGPFGAQESITNTLKGIGIKDEQFYNLQ